jgi:hypothetical protein
MVGRGTKHAWNGAYSNNLSIVCGLARLRMSQNPGKELEGRGGKVLKHGRNPEHNSRSPSGMRLE